MKEYPVLDTANLQGKTVLMRAGFDVPVEGGVVTDTTRIDAMLPTMRYILDHGASLIMMAHQGRPNGKPDPQFSQKPLVFVLEKLLGTSVQFADTCDSPATKRLAKNLQPGAVLLLENLRFAAGETSENAQVRDAFAQTLASLADLYVNDAFTNCHRDHASMTGVPMYIPGYLGFHAQKEVEGLSRVTKNPLHPVTLIISGAKIETKVPVIENFFTLGDDILVGGCIANTLLAAKGLDVGRSKYDEQFLSQASDLLEASGHGGNAVIRLPSDVVIAKEPSVRKRTHIVSVEDIPRDHAVLDIGPASVYSYSDTIAKAKTIVWNGPLGFYEVPEFAEATKQIAEAICKATLGGAVSIIGGGDTLDFHERYGFPLNAYSFVSTAGGAMLDFISGTPLPALDALER